MNLDLKKQSPLLYGILAIVVALYNIVLFVIAGFDGHEPAFWISYVMFMLALASAAVSFMLFAKSKAMLKDWFLGIPLIKLSIAYIVVEFFVSTIFIIVSDNVSWQLPFIVQLIIFAIHLILLISCFASNRMIENVNETVTKKTQSIRLLHTDATMLCEMCNDPEAKKQFEELAEMIRFSDPMSADALAPLEADIEREIRNAKMSISSQDLDDALKCCARAKLLLKERNLKCKVLK